MDLSQHPSPIPLDLAKRNVQHAVGQFATVRLKHMSGGDVCIEVKIDEACQTKQVQAGIERLGARPDADISGLYCYQGLKVEVKTASPLESATFCRR